MKYVNISLTHKKIVSLNFGNITFYDKITVQLIFSVMIIPKYILFQSNKLIKLNTFLKKFSTTTLEQKIKINDQVINYVKLGEGPQKVLFMPGALGSIWSDFKPQIEGLNQSKFTIVAWDPPGYGLSRPLERNFTTKFYENDADQAYQFMKTIGISKFSLLGWSDGGISSLILAGKYPKSVEKLVIWGANAYVTQEEIQVYEKMRDISNWSERMKAPLIALYSEKGLQDMFGAWCDALREISNNGGDICKTCLPKIECPTFILHGDKDPMVAPEHPGYLFSEIKYSKIHRFPDGKHNIHLKYAKEFNKLVTEFLTK